MRVYTDYTRVMLDFETVGSDYSFQSSRHEPSTHTVSGELILLDFCSSFQSSRHGPSTLPSTSLDPHLASLLVTAIHYSPGRIQGAPPALQGWF